MLRQTLFTILLSLALISCKTHHFVETINTEYVHDTVRVVNVDTLVISQSVINTRDSAYVEKEVVVEDDQGNIKRSNKTVVIRVKDSTSDSTDYYRSKFGALQKLYMAEKNKDNKEVQVVKEIDYRGWLCFAVLLMLNGLYFYIKIRKKWHH